NPVNHRVFECKLRLRPRPKACLLVCHTLKSTSPIPQREDQRWLSVPTSGAVGLNGHEICGRCHDEWWPMLVGVGLWHEVTDLCRTLLVVSRDSSAGGCVPNFTAPGQA
ncbi:hypothetical protein KI387_035073, partial [Taxus chinensis]